MKRTPQRDADLERAGRAFFALAAALTDDCGLEPKVVHATMRAVADLLAREE